jgi:hypothetical protein
VSNSQLTVSMLANVGLMAALDLGFNACEVERWLDSETFEPRLVFKFGDRDEMRRPRMRTPCEWWLAYDCDASCIRDRRLVEMPHSIVDYPTNDIAAKLTAALLELIPSGPAGVKDIEF